MDVAASERQHVVHQGMSCGDGGSVCFSGRELGTSLVGYDSVWWWLCSICHSSISLKNMCKATGIMINRMNLQLYLYQAIPPPFQQTAGTLITKTCVWPKFVVCLICWWRFVWKVGVLLPVSQAQSQQEANALNKLLGLSCVTRCNMKGTNQ